MPSVSSDKSVSSHALEQFTTAAGEVHGAAAAQLVRQALAAPRVFVFAELLDQTSVRQLGDSGEFASTYRLLQLFAYDVYADYRRCQADLPALTPAETLKLRHLTIVSLATFSKCIPYSDLMRELDISDTRELEDTIISAIYADVIGGRLDQLAACLYVEHVCSRDVRPQCVQAAVTRLDAWRGSCCHVLTAVQSQLQRANSLKQRAVQHHADIDTKVSAMRKGMKSQDQDDSMVLPSDSADSMAQCPERTKKLKVKSSKMTANKL